jgi:glutamine amidotransferase
MSSIAVIDYGMGNLHSVAKALEHVGDADLKLSVTSDEATILAADRVVFPGVGAIRDCMAEIKRLGIDSLIREVVQKKPVLAICVGMQALMEFSEENGGVACIGEFQGDVRRFKDGMLGPKDEHLKVPHMGWNTVKQSHPHAMWKDIPDNSRFYFVHSYYVTPDNLSEVAAQSSYPEPFTAALSRKNIFAVQFHPEKSQTHGLQMLKNFLHWNGQEQV